MDNIKRELIGRGPKDERGVALGVESCYRTEVFIAGKRRFVLEGCKWVGKRDAKLFHVRIEPERGTICGKAMKRTTGFASLDDAFSAARTIVTSEAIGS